MLICFLGHPRPDIRLNLTNRLDFSGQDVSPEKIDIVLPEDTMFLWIRKWMTARVVFKKLCLLHESNKSQPGLSESQGGAHTTSCP